MRKRTFVAALAFVLLPFIIANANGPQPSVGLYWFANVDPTAGGGVCAPLNQLLIRTDVAGLYYKSGNACTAWTAIAGSGAGNVSGTGTVSDLTAWNGASSVGNFPGATSATCPANNFVTKTTLAATGAVTNTCAAAPAGFTSTATSPNLMVASGTTSAADYPGALLKNDGGSTICSLSADGTGNCNIAVAGAGTTGKLAVFQSAPPNNRSIGSSDITNSAGISVDFAGDVLTGISDPASATGTGGATAHYLSSNSLSLATTTRQGTVPATGVATGKFLRDDLTWAAVAAGTVTSVTCGSGLTCSPNPIVGAGTISAANGGGLWSAVLSTTPTIANTGLNAWWNQPTSATATDNAVGTTVFSPNQAGNNICMRTMNSPATPYTLTILVSNTSILNADAAVTFGWSSSATSGATEFIYYLPTEQSNQLQVDRYNSAVSFNSAAYNPGAKSFHNNPLWLQISDDGTTAKYATSQDGVNFITFFSVTKSGSFLGATGYSHVVFGVHASGGAGYATIMSWKQT